MSADKKKSKSSFSNPKAKAASKSAVKHAKQRTQRDQRSKHKNEELRSQLDKLMAEGREGVLAGAVSRNCPSIVSMVDQMLQTQASSLPRTPLALARPTGQTTEIETMRNLTTLSL